MSRERLVLDKKNDSVQIFTPKAIVTVTQDVAWTPTAGTIGFCVPEACTYQINGAGASGTLAAGDPRGVREGNTYTFDTTMDIEVM